MTKQKYKIRTKTIYPSNMSFSIENYKGDKGFVYTITTEYIRGLDMIIYDLEQYNIFNFKQIAVEIHREAKSYYQTYNK
jgi:hypothetical protein